MARLPNHSQDLTPAGERKRKERGTDNVAKARAGNVTIPEPNAEWSNTTKMVWDSMLESGQTSFFESSDYAMLYLTCEGIDHWLEQGGRRSPELLRVLMQSMGSLLATEGDRRRLRIELEKPSPEDTSFEATLTNLFDKSA